MANRKKINPRTKYVTTRVSVAEENELREKAKLDGYLNKKQFSIWVRRKLGLKEENE
jgi:hypothetical protein